MTKKLKDLLVKLPAQRQSRIERRAQELANLEELRTAAQQTQTEMAQALGVGQDAISRLEKRSDMLLSTLRLYIESLGGKLQLVAQFPGRPPVVLDHLGIKKSD